MYILLYRLFTYIEDLFKKIFFFTYSTVILAASDFLGHYFLMNRVCRDFLDLHKGTLGYLS